MPPQGGKFFYANYYPDETPGFHYVRASVDNQNLKLVVTTEENHIGVIGTTCPVSQCDTQQPFELKSTTQATRVNGEDYYSDEPINFHAGTKLIRTQC